VVVEAADDVLLLQERDADEQGLPPLWLAVLQRVEHDQGEELRVQLIGPDSP